MAALDAEPTLHEQSDRLDVRLRCHEVDQRRPACPRDAFDGDEKPFAQTPTALGRPHGNRLEVRHPTAPELEAREPDGFGVQGGDERQRRRIFHDLDGVLLRTEIEVAESLLSKPREKRLVRPLRTPDGEPGFECDTHLLSVALSTARVGIRLRPGTDSATFGVL
jgi:hypothetical protein